MKTPTRLALLGLTAVTSLSTACYAPDDGASPSPASRGEVQTMSVGTIGGSAYVTEISTQGRLGIYTAERSDFTTKKPASGFVDLSVDDGMPSIAAISVPPVPGSSSDPYVFVAATSATKGITLFHTSCDYNSSSPTCFIGKFGTQSFIKLEDYRDQDPEAGILTGQAAFALRTDGRTLVLGRKTLSAPSDNGVRQTRVNGGLLLVTLGADLEIKDQQPIGGAYAINPVLAADAESGAYVAAWQDEEVGDTFVQFVDRAGAKQVHESLLPGTPKRAWTDGRTFRVLSIDTSGNTWLSNNGGTPVQGPGAVGSVCSAVELAEDGSVLSLVVSGESVTLTSSGTMGTLRLADALSPEVEISRLASCAISRTGSRIHVAWKGTQRIGDAPAMGYLYQGIEAGQVVERRRIAVDKLSDMERTSAGVSFEGTGAASYGTDQAFGNPRVHCSSDGQSFYTANSTYQVTSTCNPVTPIIGDAVTFTALAEYKGWKFAGWSGGAQLGGLAGGGCDGSTELSCSLNLLNSTQLVARYLPPSLAIGGVVDDFTGNSRGRITSSPSGLIDCTTYYNARKAGCFATLEPGTAITLTATPIDSASYEFVGWSGFAGCPDYVPTCTVTITGETQTVTPVFRSIARTVRVYLSGSPNGGTITSTVNPEGDAPLNCGSTCATRVHQGDAPITLTATPAPGFRFAGWCNSAFACMSTSSTRTVGYDDYNYISATIAVAANFQPL